MKTEQMTVHEALAELKMLDSRIEKKIMNSCFAVACKKTNKKINGKLIEDYVKSAGEDYQSANDMINRRAAIRRALSNSNASTKVVIGGTEYSVAEAIEMKRSGVDMWRHLLAQLQTQYTYAKNECDTANRRAEDKADAQVSQLLGTKEKVATADVMSLRESLIEANKMEPVCMNKIEDAINELRDKIDKFMTEVDSKLSISNALTALTIEY